MLGILLLIFLFPVAGAFCQQTVFELSPQKSLGEITEELKNYISEESETQAVIEIDLSEKEPKGFLCLNKKLKNHGQFLGYPRPYYSPLTENEKQDIRFIVTFLANNSLFALAAHKSDLQAAGDRIDHIHPLKFFTYIFTNEELKVCIRNIRNNGWVWKDFSGGIKQSLMTESNAQNMSKELVIDFARQVKIDPKLIIYLVQDKQWDSFIDTLITKIPRSGDSDRYKD